MKYFIVNILFLASYSILVSQDNWRLYPSNDSSNLITTHNDTVMNELNYSQKNGVVKIIKDARIDSVQKKLSEKPSIIGWTVQILVSQQKEEIKNTKIKFLKAFPDQQLFDEYKTPNTYLYAGRFYDKITAYHFKNEISHLFQNTRVLKKTIDLPILPEKKIEKAPQGNNENENTGNTE